MSRWQVSPRRRNEVDSHTLTPWVSSILIPVVHLFPGAGIDSNEKIRETGERSQTAVIPTGPQHPIHRRHLVCPRPLVTWVHPSNILEVHRRPIRFFSSVRSVLRLHRMPCMSCGISNGSAPSLLLWAPSLGPWLVHQTHAGLRAMGDTAG